MTEKVMDILTSHSEYDDTGAVLYDFDFVFAANDIAQMFCDKFMQREYDFVSGMYRVPEFCNDIRARIKSWVNGSGFTEQQIINSLEKLKAK